jgi:CheY-like chemotaxis protein
MEEKKRSTGAAVPGSYDAADKPFDFVEKGGKTALVCEPDDAVRENLGAVLEKMKYHVTKSAAVPDALKSMSFHLYDLIVVGEGFDGKGPDKGGVLDHIRRLPMGVRRNVFVTLLSATVRTMDRMAAFAESVDLVINRENVGEADVILQRGIADNKAFYGTFKEALKRAGRL